MPDPSLQDIEGVECKPYKPLKCLPYGQCYGFDSYCDKDERDVLPCFPSEVKDNPGELLKWCRDVQRASNSDLNPQCQAACFHEFGCSKLYPSMDFWMVAFIICAALLILSFTLNIVLLWKRKCSHKSGYSRMNSQDESQKSTVEMTEPSGDDDTALSPPSLNLQRQRSFNEEERNRRSPTTPPGDSSKAKNASPSSSSVAVGDFATSGTTYNNQRPAIGVTVRDSTEYPEESRRGTNDQIQDVPSSAGDADSSSNNFFTSLGTSQSSSSLDSSSGYSSQASLGMGLAEVEKEKKSQRAHHAPESNLVTSDQQTKVVTSLQPYKRE